MVLITGTIKDSAAQLLDGKLTVALDGSITDTTTTPHSVLVPEPYEVDVVSGALSIDLPESATSNTTYHFHLEKITTTTAYYLVSDGAIWQGDLHQHTDLEYYTGKLQSEESQLLSKVDSPVRSTLMDFHAIAPNQAAAEFSELIATGITSDVLDTSIRRLAYELTNVQEFVEAIRGGPQFLGPYDDVVYYRLNDVVSYNGSSWMWINADPGVSQVPVEGDYWTLIAAKGDAGGTGGDDTAYDATGWNGVLDAPSKNAVRDIIETLAKVSDLAGYAPLDILDSPVFLNAANAPTVAPGDSSTAIATTAFVDASFAPLHSPVFTGSPSAPTPGQASDSDALATTSFVQDLLANATLVDGSVLGNGWIELRNGLIIQWGSSANGSGAGVATFPRTFPNAVFTAVVSPVSGGTNTFTCHVQSITTTSLSYYRANTGNPASGFVYFIAIGN